MIDLGSNAFTDHVFTLAPALAAGEDAAAGGRLVASTLLLENVASGRILEGRGDGDVVAVQDELGRPILLSLSSERHLYAVVCPGGDSTERVEHDLTDGFGDDARVLAFGAGQSNDGTIHLAIAVARGGRTELHLSRPQPYQIGAAPWAAFHGQWVGRGDRAGDVEVTRVLVGNEPLRRGRAPLTIVCTREGGEADYYQVDGDLAATPAPWKRFPLPENAGKVLDLVVGRNRRGDGVYTLFEKSGQRRLFFVPHDPQAPRPELPIPPGLAQGGALGVLAAGARGETDLFLVGDGVYLLPVAKQLTGATLADVVTLAGPEVASGLRNILVCDDDQSISVWAIDRDGNLLYLQGTRTRPRLVAAVPPGDELGDGDGDGDGDDGLDAAAAVDWGAAVPGFRAGVRLIAPLRNRLQRANSLITLGLGSDLRQMLQTSDAGVYDDKPVAVRDQTRTEAFYCYATNLTLSDDAGRPFAQPPALSITASERTEVLIAGVVHDVGPQSPVTARPDAQGHVTILNRVASVASPLFYVDCAGTDRLVVDPTAKVRSALAKLNSAEALEAARLPDGTPVVTGLSRDELADAASAITSLQELSKRLPSDGSVMAGGAATASMPLGDGGVWFSMRGDGETMAYRDHTALAAGAGAAAALGWIDDAIRTFAGPVLQAMSNLARKSWELAVVLVDNVWDLAIKLGTRAYRFAVDTLAKCDQLVDWLVRTVIKVPLDKVAKWLGFVFAWDDIVVTHDVMVNVADQVLGMAARHAGDLGDRVDRFFGDLIDRVKQLTPVADPRADAGVQAQLAANRDTLDRGVDAEARRRQADAAGFEQSAAGNFASYHLRHGLRGRGSPGREPADSALDELLQGLTGIWSQVGATVTSLVTDLAGALRGGTLSMNDLIRRLAGTATIGVLEVVRTAAITAARLAGRLIERIRALLMAPLDVPLLGWLYQRHVGRPMTALGGFMLLLAVPATCLHKVLMGEAPFPFEALEAGGEQALLAAKKPRTYGLDTLTADAFWAVLAVGGGVVGGALFALYKCVASFRLFADNAYQATLPLRQALGPWLAPFMAVFKVTKFIGAGIWAGVAFLWPDTALNLIRAGRWGVSTVALVGELISLFDPTDVGAAIARIVAALVDLLLAVILTVIRLVRHAQGEQWWLWAVDWTELATCAIGHLSTLCTAVAALIPDPTTKLVLTGASYAAFALYLPLTITTTVITPYIPMTQLVDPIA